MRSKRPALLRRSDPARTRQPSRRTGSSGDDGASGARSLGPKVTRNAKCKAWRAAGDHGTSAAISCAPEGKPMRKAVRKPRPGNASTAATRESASTEDLPESCSKLRAARSACNATAPTRRSRAMAAAAMERPVPTWAWSPSMHRATPRATSPELEAEAARSAPLRAVLKDAGPTTHSSAQREAKANARCNAAGGAPDSSQAWMAAAAPAASSPASGVLRCRCRRGLLGTSVSILAGLGGASSCKACAHCCANRRAAMAAFWQAASGCTPAARSSASSARAPDQCAPPAKAWIAALCSRGSGLSLPRRQHSK